MSTPPPFYFFIPPPPAGGKTSAFSPAVVAIIAVLGSAFLVVSYYRIFAKLCTRWHHRNDDFDTEGQLNGAEVDANASPLPSHGLDEALIKSIPLFLYKINDGFTVDTECPVCLMEFADDQELRMLPKCAHAFHVACIDTWLNAHSTCPLCRANIWPEEVLSQYPPRSPQVNVYGTEARALPGSESMEFSVRDGLNGDHGRSSTPTLRGLLNYEDQHTIWIPDSTGTGDPGEESLRLYDPRDYGGDSSARHHSGVLAPTPSMRESADSRGGAYFSTDTGPQVALTRTASLKEPHSRSRDREHKWHIPVRRPSFRRKPFTRSYSMGTSRRFVHSLEFLDLEYIRNTQSKGGEKLYSPHEYGITPTPDHSMNLLISPISPTDLLVREGQKFLAGEDPAGFLLSSKSPESSHDPDLAGAALKSSAPGRGRSLSFRSPFTLKRSLSAGRSMFSFRQSSKSRIISSESSNLPDT